MPIVGRIPLPRRRPPVMALADAQHAAVPMPRARPTEEEAAAQAPSSSPFLHTEPAYDRHTAE